jgi:hypothetical protein
MPVKQQHEKQKKNYINFSFFLGISFSVCITYLLAIINYNKQKSITRGGGNLVDELKQNINQVFDLHTQYQQYQKWKEKQIVKEIENHFNTKVYILKLQNVQRNIDYFYQKDKYDFSKLNIPQDSVDIVTEKFETLRNMAPITEESYNTTDVLRTQDFFDFVNEIYKTTIQYDD